MTKSDEDALIAAEHARREALMRDDADALAAGMADTYHYAHINGLIEDREAFLARIRARLVKTHHTSTRDLRITFRPGYAIMTGASRIDYEWANGQAKGTVETLFTSVWEKRDGAWKISAYASTPQPAPA